MDTDDMNADHSKHDNVLNLLSTQSVESKLKGSVKQSAEVRKDEQRVERIVNKENVTKQAPRKQNIVLKEPPEDSKTDCEHCGISLPTDEVNISLDLHYKQCLVAQEKMRHQIMNLIYSEPKTPKRANPEASVVCQICGKKLKQASLSGHMHRHQMRCSYSTCDSIFSTKEALREHVKDVHFRLPHLYCEICGQLCVGKQRLSDHVQVVHKKMSLDINCTECDEVFINPSQMRKHRNIVHFPDKFKCHECKKSFGILQMLQRHKSVHSGEKKFQCEECGRKFKSRQCLVDHKLSHTGEKPYACQHCPYRGASSSLLAHHKKQKHKAEYEEERKQKEKEKIKITNNVQV